MPSLSFSARNLFFHHSNTYIIPLETFVFSNVNHGFKFCFSILPSPHWVFSSCHLSLLLLSFSGRAALQLNPCPVQGSSMESLLQTCRLDLLLMLLPHLTIHSSCILQTLLLASILVMGFFL